MLWRRGVHACMHIQRFSTNPVTLLLHAYVVSEAGTIKWYGVRPTVCPIIRPQARRAAGLLLSAMRAGDIERQRRLPGAQKQRRRSTGPQHGAQRGVAWWLASFGE